MSLGTVERSRVMTPVAIALGLLALAARVPSTWAVLVTATVGAVGLLAPIHDASADLLREHRSMATWVAALALGVGALLIASKLPGWLGVGPGGGRLVVLRARPEAVGASVVAAIAEEAFFRRLVYGWLSAWGTAAAIGGSALAFAAVHVPVYGFAVVPIDAAAGLLLGWQRWITGGWTAPGLTHAAANLIAEGVF